MLNGEAIGVGDDAMTTMDGFLPVWWWWWNGKCPQSEGGKPDEGIVAICGNTVPVHSYIKKFKKLYGHMQPKTH